MLHYNHHSCVIDQIRLEIVKQAEGCEPLVHFRLLTVTDKIYELIQVHITSYGEKQIFVL